MTEIEKKKTFVVHGDGIGNNEICKKCFAMFYTGNFSLHRLVAIDRDWIKTSLVADSQHTYIRYPNQDLKLICTNLVMLVALM